MLFVSVKSKEKIDWIFGGINSQLNIPRFLFRTEVTGMDS